MRLGLSSCGQLYRLALPVFSIEDFNLEIWKTPLQFPDGLPCGSHPSAAGTDCVLLSLDIVHLDDGVELRMWLRKTKGDRLRERRGHIAGPTGCGLWEIESIAEALGHCAV